MCDNKILHLIGVAGRERVATGRDVTRDDLSRSASCVRRLAPSAVGG